MKITNKKKGLIINFRKLKETLEYIAELDPF